MPGGVCYARDMEPTITPPNQSFSLRRGLLYGLLPLGLLIAVGLSFVALGEVREPRRFGEGLGRLGFWVYLLGVARSYARQTGRRWLSILTGAIFGLLLALALALMFYVRG
jgi:hypothetical protein